MEKDSFISAMRQVATPVSIVATNGPYGFYGATVSAICSLSAEPPSLLICLNRQSSILRAVEENGNFSVNIINEKQSAIASAFAGDPENATLRSFAFEEWEDDYLALPVLKNACVSFCCLHAKTEQFGTHRILTGLVIRVQTSDEYPSVYHCGSFGKLDRN